mgnify:CR=1 FL=1
MKAIEKRKVSKRQRKKGLIVLTFMIPGLLFYLIFHYAPMYGTLIAFQDFSPFRGFTQSPWVGFKHFEEFFNSIYFTRLLKNTFLLSFENILFSFPMPIIFALMMNEIKNSRLRSAIQSLSYFPNFISTVVLCGLIKNFLSPSTGIINAIIEALGGSAIDFLSSPGWFRPVYIISGIWQGMGWGSIIYYATLTSVDTSLYEAADIDGAGRFQKIFYISLPALVPTIVTLLLVNLGNMMNIGFEKVMLLYNEATYSTADIISTYVYRSGLIGQQYSFAAAVGLFNSLIGICLIVIFNFLARRFTKTSLW